jgi:anaerobic C4-dicarboxylate transporter
LLIDGVPTDTVILNLRVLFILIGKEAIMTIYDDETQVEEIKLYGYKTKPEMHALMQDKGFARKVQEEINKDQRIRKAEKELSQKPVYSTLIHIYVVIGVVTLAAAFLINMNAKNKKKKRRPGGTTEEPLNYRV